MQWSIMERGRASTEHQHLSFALDYFHHQFCLCAGLIGDSLTQLQAGASSMVAVFGAVLGGKHGPMDGFRPTRISNRQTALLQCGVVGQALGANFAFAHRPQR